jgi:hypothetical protein
MVEFRGAAQPPGGLGVLILLDSSLPESFLFWLNTLDSTESCVCGLSGDNAKVMVAEYPGVPAKSLDREKDDWNRSGEGQIVLFQRSLDSFRLQNLSVFLDNPRIGYHLSVILVEPTSRDGDLKRYLDSFVSHPHIRLREVWVSGVQDSDQIVTTDRSMDLQEDFSRLLYFIAVKPTLLGDLWEGAQPPDGDAVFWGMASFTPERRHFHSLRAALYERYLERDRQIRKNRDESDRRALNDLADSLVNVVTHLEIPHAEAPASDSQGSTMSALRWSDRLQTVPEPDGDEFGKFYFTRERLMEEVPGAILRFSRKVEGYREILRRQVGEIGPQVRERGQRTMAREIDKMIKALEPYFTPHSVPMVLNEFFAKFIVPEGKEPGACQPQSQPDVMWIRTEFSQRPKEMLDGFAERFPTRMQVVLAFVLLVLAVSGALAFLAYQQSWKVWMACMVLGSIPLGVLWLKARSASSQWHETLREHYEDRLKNLRQAFTNKVDWVVAKTEATFRNQFSAHIASSSRRMREAYDFLRELFYLEVKEIVPDHTSGPDVIEGLVESLGQHAREVLANSIRMGNREADDIKNLLDFVHLCDRRFFALLSQDRIPVLDRDAIANMAWPVFHGFSRNHFAQLDGRKAYLLPNVTRDEYLPGIEAYSNAEPHVVTGSFPGVMVVNLKRTKDPAAIAEALEEPIT